MRVLAIITMLSLLAIPYAVVPYLLYPFISSKVLLFRAATALLVVANFRRIRLDPIGLALIFLLITGFISDIQAKEPLLAIWSDHSRMDGWIGQAFLTVFYFVAAPTFESLRFRGFFIDTMLVLSIGVIPAWAIFAPHSPEALTRPETLFGNPTYYGGYALWMIFLSYWRMGSQWLNWRLLIVLANTAGIVLAQDRGALVGLLAGIAVMTFMQSKIRLEIILAGLGIALLALPISVLHLMKGNDIDIVMRLSTWKQSALLILENPVWGYGHEGLHWVLPGWDRAHNFLLDWGIEGGFVGIASHALICAAILRAVLLDKKKAALLAAFAAYFVNLAFVFDTIATTLPFYALASMIRTQGYSVEFRSYLQSEDKGKPLDHRGMSILWKSWLTRMRSKQAGPHLSKG